MKGMSFSNMIYMVMWLFTYYFTLLIVPYMTNLFQGMSIFAGLWSGIPAETQWLIQILMYIVIPLCAIAYTIKSSNPESQIVVQQ